MPVFDMREETFTGDKFDVWGIGVMPVRIEIMSAVKGLNFEETYNESQIYIEEELNIRFVHLNHLIRAKKASGRFRDLGDIEQLSK